MALAGLTVAALSKSKTKTIEQTRPGHELVSDRRRPELGGDQHEPLAVPQCLASLVLSPIARDAGWNAPTGARPWERRWCSCPSGPRPPL